MARRSSFTNVIVFALCAIATMLTMVVRPSPTSFAPRGHESIGTLNARAMSVARVDREAPSVQRRVASAAGGSPDALLPVFAIGSSLPSIAPLELAELRPATWIAWCDSPTRARADLMVFLN